MYSVILLNIIFFFIIARCFYGTPLLRIWIWHDGVCDRIGDVNPVNYINLEQSCKISKLYGTVGHKTADATQSTVPYTQDLTWVKSYNLTSRSHKGQKKSHSVQWTLEGISQGLESEPLSLFRFLSDILYKYWPAQRVQSKTSFLSFSRTFTAEVWSRSNQLLRNDWEKPTLAELAGVSDGLWRLIELWIRRGRGHADGGRVRELIWHSGRVSSVIASISWSSCCLGKWLWRGCRGNEAAAPSSPHALISGGGGVIVMERSLRCM